MNVTTSNLGNPLRLPGFAIVIVTRRNYYYAYGVEALVLTEQLTATVIRSYYLVVEYHSPGRTESRRSQL